MEVKEASARYLPQQESACPPGYKQTDVGVIPEDWEVTTLSHVCTKITDGTHDTPRSIDRGVPYLTAIHVKENKIDFDGCYYLPQEIHDEIYKRCNPEYDDVLMVNIGAGIATTALVTVDYEFSLKNVALLKPSKAQLSGPYLKFYQSFVKSKIVESISAGGAQPFLSLRQIGELKISLPPTKAEQEAIAEALSDTDALIESLKQLIAKKCHIKQGAMQELLTGKRRLPGFSREWDEKTFGEIFDFHSTATNSRSDLKADGDTFYIHYGDIHTQFHSRLDFQVKQPPKIDRVRCKNATLLKNGDWIMADASEDFDGVGKTIEISGLTDGMSAVAGLHTFLLREKEKTFEPGFKGHLGNLKSLHDQYLRVATGMKVYGVSKAALKDLVLPVPEPNEQIAITAILSVMDNEISVLEKKLTKLRQLKQGMMHELLTGRIRLVKPSSKSGLAAC